MRYNKITRHKIGLDLKCNVQGEDFQIGVHAGSAECLRNCERIYKADVVFKYSLGVKQTLK